MRSVYSYRGEKCPVENCENIKQERGHCAKHAQRIRRYGDPNYVTPKDVFRKRLRETRPNFGKAKETTYLKNLGKHEHRKVMEEHLGRRLNRNEVVHHIDGDKHNNSIENLQIMTQSEHLRLHREEMQQLRNEKTKTHCRRGHAYTGKVTNKGAKICIPCIRAAQKRFLEKKNAAKKLPA